MLCLSLSRSHNCTCGRLKPKLFQASVKAYRSIEKASGCIWELMSKLRASDRVSVATELVKTFKEAVYEMVDIGKGVQQGLMKHAGKYCY